MCGDVVVVAVEAAALVVQLAAEAVRAVGWAEVAALEVQLAAEVVYQPEEPNQAAAEVVTAVDMVAGRRPCRLCHVLQ